VVEPQAWLDDFEARVDAARQKAAAFGESLNSAGATASSSDGTVTVTVAPNGSLSDLRITDAALRGSGSQLAALVMRTAREAQRQAAQHVLTAFTALGGTDSEATRMLTGFVPPPEDEPTEPRSAARRRSPYPADETDRDGSGYDPENW
jgi:DNA-binding protein YbaB